jgi:acyl-CoA synthetase (AMP-forming)/AMP-acid ligase II
LTVTGRIKLLIDVGGFKVNPLEVEQVLCRHPSIGEAVVVPIVVTDTVSRLKAVVTSARPGEPVPVEEVRAFVRSVLAAHKVPRVVEVVSRLPKSPTGKVLRRQLEGGS